MKYQVIVGNIGQTTDTNDEAEARKDYNEYVEISKSGVGRAGNEPVVLMEDGEPIEEHSPPEDEDYLGPTDPSWKEVLEETDWSLLRDQKETLLGILRKFHKKENLLPQNEREALDGIVNFLDSVQDAAAEEIGEETVFGNLETTP